MNLTSEQIRQLAELENDMDTGKQAFIKCGDERFPISSMPKPSPADGASDQDRKVSSLFLAVLRGLPKSP